MPYFCTDLRTAINRCALFMSVGQLQRAVVLRSATAHRYAVLDYDLWVTDPHHYSKLGFSLCINLLPDEIPQLTGAVQLSLLEEDIYAIGQKDL